MQSKYAERLNKDLAANRKGQADITEQLARFSELQERLEQLRSDEVMLTRLHAALSDVNQPGPEGTTPATADDAQTVPNPRQDAAAKPGKSKFSHARAAGTQTPAKKSASAKATTQKTATAQKAAPAQKTAQNAEPLHQLIFTLLLKTPGEPHLVREVLSLLNEAHPGRNPSIQVVRNNLEVLVKRGSVERQSQQNSVMYTAPAAVTEAAQPAESAPEKVTAQV